jgi:flavodoxin
VKTAIVYYSLEGNCALAAGVIKELLNKERQIDADILEIKTEDTKKRAGLAKYFWGGSQVFMHKKPALRPYSFDAGAYDLIILGCPVWAASPAPPIASFQDKTKISGKKLALFVCHGGGKGSALEKFKALLPGNDVSGEIDFTNPGGGNREELKQKIGEWVKTLIP